METKILKVVAQTEAVYVPSKKSDNGQLAKSMIRLKELGGDYETFKTYIINNSELK